MEFGALFGMIEIAAEYIPASQPVIYRLQMPRTDQKEIPASLLGTTGLTAGVSVWPKRGQRCLNKDNPSQQKTIC
ncbi:hypothetical protein [Brevundimonas variabilis]|uniref:hypothetical protein n=1 Tax=Brevundimonas variabilis TaxID=74312 RepID=UPI0016060F7F|nr:hypothetical protein [Brevundimonas variabilis]